MQSHVAVLKIQEILMLGGRWSPVWGTSRERRVNKIKFSPKNARNMINVCHVGGWIEENETPPRI